MRTLRLVLLVMPSVAWAGWTNGPLLTGAPVDIQAYDGGYFTVTTATNACGYLWNGTTAVQQDCATGTTWTGTAFNTPTCVIALNGSNGKMSYGTGCGGGAPFSLPNPSGVAVQLGFRLRGARMGAELVTVRDNGGGYYAEGGRDAGSFTAALNFSIALPTVQTLSALSWSGDDWFLFAQGSTSSLNHLTGGSQGSALVVTLPSGTPRDLALYDNGATLGAFGIDNSGAQLWRSLDVQTTGLTQLDAGSVGIDGGATMSSVDFVQTQGSANGRGFGLLGAGSTLLGSVPDPSNPGGVWVDRSVQPAIGGATVVKVSCADPTFCVVLDSTGQVFLYTNGNLPVLGGAIGPVFVPAGSVSQPIAFTAVDPDGDPVWATMQLDAGTLLNFNPVPGALSATFDAPSCPGSAIVTLTASDGYGPHDAVIGTTVAWDIPAPVITSVNPQVRAGATPITLTASAPTCGLTDFWFIIDGGTYPPTLDAGVVTPPANACAVSNALIGLSQPAIDGGVRSAQVSVEIDPYGPPNAPAFDGGLTVLDAGLYFFSAGPIHACANAEAFVSTIGLQVNNPFVSQGLVVIDAGTDGVTILIPPLCVLPDAGVPMTVTYARTIDDQTTNPAPQFQTSDAGTLAIFPAALQPPLPPLTSATTFTFTAAYDAGPSVVAGDVSNILTPVCANVRAYRADISISSDAGISIADGGFSAPGPWALTVPTQCSGDFIASATLTDQNVGGTSATLSQAITIDNGAKAIIGNLDGDATISCSGGGGEVTIELDGGCPSQTYQWSEGQGPSFTLDAGNSRTVSIGFQANQLDALAGGVACLQVTAHNGSNGANDSTGQRGVLITPTPFITAQLNPDPVQPNEEEPAGVEVILTNTTSCAVTGIGVREGLNGLALVPDSVRVNGQKHSTTVQGGILSIDGLSLSGHETVHLTYRARVPLLGHPNPKTEVVMVRGDPGQACPLTSGGPHTFDVTLGTSPGTPPRQCGCDAAPDALVLLLTLSGLLFRRRKR